MITNVLNNPKIKLDEPCPFCGSSEIMIIMGSEPWLKKLACDCGCSMGIENHHTDGWADRLIERWNTRFKT